MQHEQDLGPHSYSHLHFLKIIEGEIREQLVYLHGTKFFSCRILGCSGAHDCLPHSCESIHVDEEVVMLKVVSSGHSSNLLVF
jgi:hypothetical protein